MDADHGAVCSSPLGLPSLCGLLSCVRRDPLCPPVKFLSSIHAIASGSSGPTVPPPWWLAVGQAPASARTIGAALSPPVPLVCVAWGLICVWRPVRPWSSTAARLGLRLAAVRELRLSPSASAGFGRSGWLRCVVRVWLGSNRRSGRRICGGRRRSSSATSSRPSGLRGSPTWQRTWSGPRTAVGQARSVGPRAPLPRGSINPAQGAPSVQRGWQVGLCPAWHGMLPAQRALLVWRLGG